MPGFLSRRFFLVAPLVLNAALAGCQTPPPPRAFPEISFANRSPIQLDVAQIEVVQRYRPPAAPPHVDHLFPQNPSDVLRRWADQRLRAVGRAGTARFIIEDAGVLEEGLARTPGLRGAFTIDQAERYTIRLAVRMKAQNPVTGTNGFATADDERSTTVAENATLADREATWYRLIDESSRDLDARLETNIRRLMGPLVLR